MNMENQAVMNWKEIYRRWNDYPLLEKELSQTLLELEANPEQLEDCFYKNLEFGTGGMRGEIGPGPNRMNVYTIRKAAAGLAKYIIEEGGEEGKKRGVVIAYDSRHKSPEFALESAKVLGAFGIYVSLFDALRPTPELSFAVRYLNAYAGIVITASHNPPEYNGFKVYGPDGGQLPPEPADKLIQKVNEIEDELLIETIEAEAMKEAGLLTMIGQEVDVAYNERLQTILLNHEAIARCGNKIKIVFTPLHGTANIPVRRALETAGFSQVTIVKEQEKPDPNFSTVISPNPEEHAAFSLAIRYGKQIDADLLIATDPDADRVGLAVKDESGEYVVLTGNQTGALMLDYLLSQKQLKGTLPSNAVMLQTIVTSALGKTISRAFGVEVVETLTGFKFIGEKMNEYERTGEKTFQFGYEESYGYLIGDFVRDKDAVQTALFAAEMTAYYKKRGLTLFEALHALYEEYGYYREGLESLTLKGKQGVKQIENILSYFRLNPPELFANQRVVISEDYQLQKRYNLLTKEKQDLLLPVSNVLKYTLEDGSWVCMRPSGTEPKIKFYFGVKRDSLAESENWLIELKSAVMKEIENIIN